MKVMASDADDPTYGSSARIVYSVLEGERFFSVDRQTGKNMFICSSQGLFLLWWLLSFCFDFFPRCFKETLKVTLVDRVTKTAKKPSSMLVMLHNSTFRLTFISVVLFTVLHHCKATIRNNWHRLKRRSVLYFLYILYAIVNVNHIYMSKNTRFNKCF